MALTLADIVTRLRLNRRWFRFKLDSPPYWRQRRKATIFIALISVCFGCSREANESKLVQHASLRPHQIAIISIAFSPEGGGIVTGGDDLIPPGVRSQRLGRRPGEWSLIETADGEQRHGPMAIGDRVRWVGFADEGASLLVMLLGTPTRVLRFDVASGVQAEELKCPEDASFGAAVSRDGRLVAWACNGDRVRVWDRIECREVTMITATDKLHGGYLAFAPDGLKLATVLGPLLGRDKKTAIWDATTGEVIVTLASQSHILFSPDGKLIATNSDRIVTLWDVPSGQPNRELNAGAEIDCVVFSPDGTKLIAAVVRWRETLASRLPFANASSKHVAEYKIWNVADGSLFATIRDRDSDSSYERVSAMAFSADDRMLAVGDYGGRVRLLNVSTVP